MRQRRKKVIVALIGLFAGTSFAMVEPLWLYDDSISAKYSFLRSCDTTRATDLGCVTDPVDTGLSFDGSPYFNFDYQFSSDTVKILHSWDTTIILYSYLRPGFAGFRTDWNGGELGFALARYTYLVFAHKGPNLNHKVTVTGWYNHGSEGSPLYNSLLGTFSGSDNWKIDTILIPEIIRNLPDKERNSQKYYELVFIINNFNPGDMTSGPPGCLKIDNIRLAGRNPIDSSSKSLTVDEGASASLSVSISRADSMEKISYQWEKNGREIQGAINPEYIVSSATPDDTGRYSVAVKVSSTGLTFNTQAATISVNPKNALVPKNFKKNGRKDSFSARFAPNGHLHITSSLSRTTGTIISLYTIDGRTLIDRFFRTFTAGTSDCNFGTRVRGKGIYVVTIDGEKGGISQEIVVIR